MDRDGYRLRMSVTPTNLASQTALNIAQQQQHCFFNPDEIFGNQISILDYLLFKKKYIYKENITPVKASLAFALFSVRFFKKTCRRARNPLASTILVSKVLIVRYVIQLGSVNHK